MASIINALRNISSDSWWFPKILFLAVPIFLIINSSIIDQYNYQEKVVFCTVIGILYLGNVGFLMNRNINNKSPILPSLFSLPDFFSKTIGMTIVSVPFFILYAYVIQMINIYCVFEPFVMFVIYSCVTLFLSPFVLIPSVLYAANGKIKDAFNYKIIIEAAGNFSVGFLLFVIQYAFTIFLLSYLFYALFTEMVVDKTAVNVVYSISFVISLLSLYSFISDMYDQEIPRLPDHKKNEKKKLRQPDETEIIY